MKHGAFLSAADGVTIVFVLFLSLVEGIFFSHIASAELYLTANIGLITFVYFSAYAIAKRKDKPSRIITILHDWYLVPAIYIIYTQASSISFPIHQKDFDAVLIAIDRWIFGFDPTTWISQFAFPLLTELLQIAYSLYYFFFILLFLELYRRTNKDQFFLGAMLVVYGFYLSYIGYLLVPAVGPRFTLHDFSFMDKELPGLFFTPLLRSIINSGGGIPEGVTNPLAFVHRDAFPSGHTQLTLVAMYVAFATRVKSRWFIAIAGTLLIISTIYMRYHYFIDVLAGVCFFFFTIWSGKKIYRWWNNYQRTNFLPT